MSILKELNGNKDQNDAMPLLEAIMITIDEVTGYDQLDESRNHANARFQKFFNSNKELVRDASVIALSNFANYNKNTRKTITLHAKDNHERRTIGSIVDALVLSKKFKIAKTKFHSGRKIWIMKKT